MKIKKFLAPDIRRAIKMVRDEQGPDAVIISNRRVDGGVEIVSAVDYDETLLDQVHADPEKTDRTNIVEGAELVKNDEISCDEYTYSPSSQINRNVSLNTQHHDSHVQEPLLREMREEIKYLRKMVENKFFELEWANYSSSHPIGAKIITRLLNCGVSSRLARDIAEELSHADRLETAWDSALSKLGDRLQIVSDDIINEGGVVALVGPTGVGKTTTIAKLAARYALRRGVRHVALLTTDSYRVGAHEQLRTYGRLLDMPVRSASNKEELQIQLDDLVDKDLVLIDTAGMSQRDMRISEQLSVLRESKANIKVYLTLSATSQLVGIEEVINVFSGIDLDGCILTKLDEATCIGPAISAIIEKNLPIAYVSNGQRVPEDLHLARVDGLINEDNFNMKRNEDSSTDELMRSLIGRTAANAH